MLQSNKKTQCYDYDLSVIIVSYNTRNLTCKALATLYEETQVSFETIVIDNNSSDGSADEIEQQFPSVKLIKLEKNLGFAEGNNIGARESRGEYLLLLNPDTEVLPGAIDTLMDCARKNPEAKIWGGRTLFADGSLNPASCWSKQTLWGLISQAVGLNSLFRKSYLFNPEGIGGWDRSDQRQVDIVSGCFLMITKEFWVLLDGFCPDFFMYGEEADLCLRAKEMGAQPTVFSTATIIHHGGASERVRADKLVRLLKAKALLINRHFGPLTRDAGLVLLLMWPFSRLIIHLLAATLGRSTSKISADAWREVWRRRTEWFPP